MRIKMLGFSLHTQKPDAEEQEIKLNGLHRIEVPLIHPPTDQQYKIILLDADDTFDVIVQYPNGYREAVWVLLKDSYCLHDGLPEDAAEGDDARCPQCGEHFYYVVPDPDSIESSFWQPVEEEEE